ncbi:MAG: hypothetical protein HQL97_04575 [Magnetococcales bacterium]|nr:hypothetical protein [Magnetococcales bacterium]
MAYTSKGIFYVNPEAGSDAVRSNLVPSAYANNGSGLVRVTVGSLGSPAIATGAVVVIAGTSSSLYVGTWKVTVIDSTTIDLQESTYTSNPATKGTVIPWGGSSLADAWCSFGYTAHQNHTQAGDEVRVMASPAPTSIGSATWTGGSLKATVNITSSTNATPIAVTATGHSLVDGDTVLINGHTTNTNANGVWLVAGVSGSTFQLTNADGTNSVGNGVGGASGTLRNISMHTVKLASALTQNVAVCGNQGQKTAWTASANVTADIYATDYREGFGSCRLQIAAGFTTGLAAYVATGTLDLSAYQQISFWIKQTSGTIGAHNSVALTLCTGADGTGEVHNVPIEKYLDSVGNWCHVVYDFATNLNSAIASVGFVVNTDNGAQTFLIDNIVACKAVASADSLTHRSLISKNTTNEPWYAIHSINGPLVLLAFSRNDIYGASPPRGYGRTTETVTTYKRSPARPPWGTLYETGYTGVFTPHKTGTMANPSIFSGGWDRTDMSTQTDETWIDGQFAAANGTLAYNIAGYTYFDKLNAVRCTTAFNNSGVNPVLFGVFRTAACLNTVASAGADTWTFGTLEITGGTLPDLSAKQFSCSDRLVLESSLAALYLAPGQSYGDVVVRNGGGVGVYFNGWSRIRSVTAENNASYGLYTVGTGDVVYGGGATSGNAVGVRCNAVGSIFLNRMTLNEATKVSWQSNTGSQIVFSGAEGGDQAVNYQYHPGGLVVSQTAVRHTATGIAWKISPTSTALIHQYRPLRMSVAKVAVRADTQVSASVWLRRDNTGLTLRLVYKGGQIAGAASDVTASMTAIADTWEHVTIQFTPTENGVVELAIEAFGGTTYNGYVDDLTVSQ